MNQENGLSSQDLTALVESARELSSEIDLAILLERILEKAGELTDSPAGSVLLYKEERKGLFFAAATGDTATTVLTEYGEDSNEVVPLVGSKAGSVFTSGKSLVDHTIESDPEHFKKVDQQTKKTTASMLCVPLTSGNERLGVIQIINKRSGNYSDRDRIILEHFGSHAAVAIRNARSFKMLLAHMGLYSSPGSTRNTEDLIRQLETPAHEERMTLLFADMRGFTQLTQAVRDPEVVQKLLNEFLSAVAREIIRHDGVVNKFLGDGVLALFRDDNTEMRAIRSAFSIVERFDALHEHWNRSHNQDLSFLDVGIGIVTDKVIIGTIGSKRVRDFTVIGTPVNLAAAFEQAARGGRRVLVDQSTFNRDFPFGFIHNSILP